MDGSGDSKVCELKTGSDTGIMGMPVPVVDVPFQRVDEPLYGYGPKSLLTKHRRDSDIFCLGHLHPLPSMFEDIQQGKKVAATPLVPMFATPAGKPSGIHGAVTTPTTGNSGGHGDGDKGSLTDPRGVRRNLVKTRELGGNPITGEGYPMEEAKMAGGRRLFKSDRNSAPLW